MSNKVLSAALKAAVNTSAMKQVAAAGLSVSRSACTFVGTNAYAVWSSEHSYSGGYGVSVRPSFGNCRQFRINYPAIPDDALLTRTEADLIAAYTLHETGHVIYTPNNRRDIDRFPLSRKLHALANGFEDGRMEACVINGDIAHNARQLFSRLLGKITADISRGWNPCDIANAPFAIALLSREALGNGNEFTAALLDRIPEPYRAIYQTVYEDSKTAPMGFDEHYWSYSMALKFYSAWRLMRNETPKAEPEQPDLLDEDPRKIELDDPQGEEEISQPGLTEGDFDEEEGGESGDDFDDTDDSEEGDKPKGSDKPDAETEEQDGDESDEDGESKEGEAGTGYSASGDSGEPKSPEPSIDDIFKRINKRSEGTRRSSLGAFTPAPRGYDMMDYLKERGIS